MARRASLLALMILSSFALSAHADWVAAKCERDIAQVEASLSCVVGPTQACEENYRSVFENASSVLPPESRPDYAKFPFDNRAMPNASWNLQRKGAIAFTIGGLWTGFDVASGWAIARLMANVGKAATALAVGTFTAVSAAIYYALFVPFVIPAAEEELDRSFCQSAKELKDMPGAWLCSPDKIRSQYRGFLTKSTEARRELLGIGKRKLSPEESTARDSICKQFGALAQGFSKIYSADIDCEVHDGKKQLMIGDRAAEIVGTDLVFKKPNFLGMEGATVSPGRYKDGKTEVATRIGLFQPSFHYQYVSRWVEPRKDGRMNPLGEPPKYQVVDVKRDDPTKPVFDDDLVTWIMRPKILSVARSPDCGIPVSGPGPQGPRLQKPSSKASGAP